MSAANLPPSPARPGHARFAWLRAALYGTVVPWIIVCTVDTRHGFAAWLLIVLSGALLGGLARRLAPVWLSSPPARALELAAWNLLVCFLGAEVGLRVWGAIGSPPAWLDMRPDPLHYRLDPATDWLGTWPNSRGFYDVEHTPEKPPGVLRVAALGDSYTVGMVPFGYGYIARVDAALGDAIEMINLGVVHTAVPEYEEILRADGLSFDPDLVLIGIYVGNDIRRDEPRGLFSPVGSKALMAARVLALLFSGGPYRQTLSGEALYETRADGTLVELPLLSPDQHLGRARKHLEQLFREPRDERARDAWRDTEASLRRLVGLCRERGLPVAATIAADELQVDDALFERVVAGMSERPEAFDRDYPNRRLRRLFASLDVPVLDLTAALRAAQAIAPTYHTRGAHWNAHGNAAAADALAGWLAERVAALEPGREPRPVAVRGDDDQPGDEG